jgi:NAD(P) transhydrogenase subunit beta
MLIAVLVTFAVTHNIHLSMAALLVGGLIGWYAAKRVEMTQMPELVAAMHSLVGLAAVLIASAVVASPTAFNLPDPIPAGNRIELFLGTFIGAMTFSGSIIAFGKLAGWATSSGCSRARRSSSRAADSQSDHRSAMIGFGIAFFVAAPARSGHRSSS